MRLGNLEPTRDLTYVKDTCSGFLEIYNSEHLIGEIINIGMNSEISIEELAQLIAKLMNVDLNIQSSEERVRPKNSEVERLFCDNSKLLKHTSWEPKYSLKDGIRQFIKWIQKIENFNYYKPERYNV